MYLVQSVLFDKSKFSLHLSKEWLKHHHYHLNKVDDKPKTYRFRQITPKEAKKQGYTNFKTKKLGKSGVSLVLAYNECLCGGGLYNHELHHFLFNSYSNGKDYKEWKLDHSLSDKQVQVYFNPTTSKAVVVHRGSINLQDWYENAKMAFGFKEGIEHSKKIQKEAERKYGAENVITIGHSRGSRTAEEVGKNSGEIITLNKPVTTWDLLYRKKVPEHQTDIKTGLDPVSFLRPLQLGKKYEHIKSDTYNPLTEHYIDVLKRVGDEKYWGKGRCWKGYKPVPGKKPYSKGSCKLIGGAISTEAQYRKAVSRMEHLLKEKSLLDEEKDDLEEKFNEVIEYADEKFDDLDYIDALKFKVVLDLMIKKKIFTKRAKECLSNYFAEEEEERYSDDFEPYTGKGRKTGSGCGTSRVNVEFEILFNHLQYLYSRFETTNITREQERSIVSWLREILRIRPIPEEVQRLIGFIDRAIQNQNFSQNTITQLLNVRRELLPLTGRGRITGAGSGIITNKWNKTERELRDILENNPGPFHQDGDTYYRILFLFNELLKMINKMKDKYPTPTPTHAWREILPFNRIVLHLYNDFVRDNPRFPAEEHPGFVRLRTTITQLGQGNTANERRLTPREEEEEGAGLNGGAIWDRLVDYLLGRRRPIEPEEIPSRNPTTRRWRDIYREAIGLEVQIQTRPDHQGNMEHINNFLTLATELTNNYTGPHEKRQISNLILKAVNNPHLNIGGENNEIFQRLRHLYNIIHQIPEGAGISGKGRELGLSCV